MNDSLDHNDKMPFCPNCGRKNIEQASFCPDCGQSLIKKQNDQLFEEVPPARQASRNTVLDNDGYREIPVETRPVRQRKKKKFPKWIIVVVILLIFGAYGRSNDRHSTTTDPVAVVTERPRETPQPTPKPTPEPTPEPQVNGAEAVNNGDYSLVTPEFKKAMDEYEAFYDEYIAFMSKYDSEGDTLSMMTDYMSMLTRLSQWVDYIDTIDESQLSSADYAYYLLVSTRVSTKLMNASFD